MRIELPKFPEIRTDWHVWFAWHPVCLDHQLVWWEKVERKECSGQEIIHVFDGTERTIYIYRWEYREVAP